MWSQYNLSLINVAGPLKQHNLGEGMITFTYSAVDLSLRHFLRPAVIYLPDISTQP